MSGIYFYFSFGESAKRKLKILDRFGFKDLSKISDYFEKVREHSRTFIFQDMSTFLFLMTLQKHKWLK
jgi:hypothetical protein